MTVTAHVALFSPAVAVMVADPTLTAVTFPLPLTVTMSVEEDFQVTLLSVALFGAIVALKVSVSPSSRVRVVLLREISVTATGVVVGVDGVGVIGSFDPHPAIRLENIASTWPKRQL